jgi:polar amino acid transport system substrate-binding protein
MRCVAMLLMMWLWATLASAGATLDRVKKSGILNDVLVNTYPPFGFIDGDNELAGFDVDVARAFAAKLGATLKLATPGWETIVSGRWQGRWDICICSMSPTDERAKVLSFPVRYYSSPAVLTVHKDERHIESIADISGKRIGVGIGSSYENYVNQALVIPGAAPIAYSFHDVLATAQANIEATHRLKIVGSVLYSEPNVVATERGDPEWDRTVVQTFNELKSDGTLTRLSKKWFGLDITLDGR